MTLLDSTPTTTGLGVARALHSRRSVLQGGSRGEHIVDENHRVTPKPRFRDKPRWRGQARAPGATFPPMRWGKQLPKKRKTAHLAQPRSHHKLSRWRLR